MYVVSLPTLAAFAGSLTQLVISLCVHDPTQWISTPKTGISWANQMSWLPSQQDLLKIFSELALIIF